ncbi:MAG TPA: diguanylate cyclase [Thermodesulfobacteriota bacterium]|nr:diguanylate cyclase [Thermodesulfobacteriota bacterium]
MNIQSMGSTGNKIATGSRLSIVDKMLLGYIPIFLLIIFLSCYVLFTLKRLIEINNSIINTDLAIIETIHKMIDTVLSQESYGRRYIILESPDILPLFWERSKEFNNLASRIRTIPDQDSIPVDLIVSLHREYNNLFISRFEHRSEPPHLKEGTNEIDGKIEKKQEELLALLNEIALKTRSHRNEKTFTITRIGTSAFQIVVALCVLGFLFGVIATSLITQNISSSIGQLKLATQKISEGKFDSVPNIQSRDELGELSFAFSEMAKRLKNLEETYLDASPLTRLPGGVAIEETLKRKLDTDIPTAFCFLDMRNFKSFNDRYGYARGNELIQATTKLIKNAVARHGTGEDFIGHIGGDDFVIITSLKRHDKMCNSIIEEFDKMVPDFYDPEDRSRGYIIGETRQGQKMFFPIITLSIAVVTNQDRELKSHIKVGEIAAELKEYLKKFPGSMYVVDRRKEES